MEDVKELTEFIYRDRNRNLVSILVLMEDVKEQGYNFDKKVDSEMFQSLF